LIRISTASLATTYLNDPDSWDSLVKDGFFQTADMGVMQEDKLLVTGRSDEVIITGGENVSLPEVEKIIHETFTGVQCAAFAIADPQWGQSLHLAIAGSVHPDQSAINEYLSSQISVAAKVKRFIYVDELPRTSLDKIDRPKLIQIAMGDSQ